MPALVVEVPAAPEAARPWPVRLHGVGQLRDTLLRGCRKGHWEAACPQRGHPVASPVVACRGRARRVEGRRGVQVPGHCLQQSEGLARTGLAQVSRGHCTFSQCTSPVVPCGERRRLMGGTGQSVQVTHPPPWFEPLLQCLAAQGSHHGCQGSSAAKPGSGSWGGLGPKLTLQVQMAHLMRPKGGTTGCQRVPEPRHVLSPSK